MTTAKLTPAQARALDLIVKHPKAAPGVFVPTPYDLHNGHGLRVLNALVGKGLIECRRKYSNAFPIRMYRPQ